jgi:hypothetical protein
VTLGESPDTRHSTGARERGSAGPGYPPATCGNAADTAGSIALGSPPDTPAPRTQFPVTGLESRVLSAFSHTSVLSAVCFAFDHFARMASRSGTLAGLGSRAFARGDSRCMVDHLLERQGPQRASDLSRRAASNAFHPSNNVASALPASPFRSGIGSGRGRNKSEMGVRPLRPVINRPYAYNKSAGSGCPEASRGQCCQQYRQHCHRSPEDTPAPRAPNAH